ncbi:MAG TPA: hypothetical protein VGD88_08155 [Opitutaceae bacterium]
MAKSRFSPVLVICAALSGLLVGCKTLPRYYAVGVDAITARPELGGTSYLLIAQDPSAYRDPALHGIAVMCVKAALEGRGLYEAPRNSRPDLIIEMDYGRGNSIRLGPNGTTQEIYLSLSSRLNPGEGATRRGEEIWNVRASILDETTRAVVILPILAAVAADHAGTETGVKQEFSISDQSPTVAQITATLGLDKLAK